MLLFRKNRAGVLIGMLVMLGGLSPVCAEESLSDGDENVFEEIVREEIPGSESEIFTALSEADLLTGTDGSEEEITGSSEGMEELPLAEASSGACGKSLKWSFSNGTLTITGTGAMYDYDWEHPSPWAKDASILKKMKTAVIESGVTSIGNCAFMDCSELEKITFPDTLTTVGERAFEYCTDLEEAVFPGCKKLGYGAFRFCEDLSAVQLPEGIAEIGEWAFESCVNLKAITLPYGIKTIPEGTFRGCSSLSTVTMYDSVVSVGKTAFRDCKALHALKLSRNINNIGQYAFHGSGLKEIAIPTGVTLIDYGTFFDCASLAKVELPYTLKEVRRGAFMDCISLKNISFTGNAAQWKAISVDRENNAYLTWAKVSYIDPPVEEIVPSVVYRLADEGSGFLRIYWRTIRGADGYQIRWSQDNTMKKGVKSASYSGCNNAVRGDLEVGGTYYAQVRVFTIEKGERVYTSWSGKKSITLTKQLASPVIRDLSLRGGKVRASWTAAEGVEGYQVRFADNAQFRSAFTASVRGGNTLSYSRSGLAAGKNWYASVRSYRVGEDGNRYYSKWSDTLQISY